MEIRKAIVVRTDDAMKSGTLGVRDGEVPGIFKVKYTSPYINRHAGFVAIPELNTEILIVKPDNDENWYYMSSIAHPGYKDADVPNLKDESPALPDSQIYKARGVPQRLVLKSPKGNKLVLSDEFNSDYFNLKVELESAQGKRIILTDSPLIDSIIISNQYGDRIRISGDAAGIMGKRSIDVDCQGSINLTSRESCINLRVVDGREINIINTSTGSKRANENDPTPGNINIESSHGDINLTTKGSNGDIHLTTEGSGGNIVLQAEKGVVSIRGAAGVEIAGAGAEGSVVSDVVVKGTNIHLN